MFWKNNIFRILFNKYSWLFSPTIGRDSCTMQGPGPPGVWWAFLCHATRSCWRLVQASSLAWFHRLNRAFGESMLPRKLDGRLSWLSFFSPHDDMSSSIHCISIWFLSKSPNVRRFLQIKWDSFLSPNFPGDAFQICAFFLRISRIITTVNPENGSGWIMVMSRDVDFQWRVEANETHGYVIYCSRWVSRGVGKLLCYYGLRSCFSPKESLSSTWCQDSGSYDHNFFTRVPSSSPFKLVCPTKPTAYRVSTVTLLRCAGSEAALSLSLAFTKWGQLSWSWSKDGCYVMVHRCESSTWRLFPLPSLKWRWVYFGPW